MVPSQICFCCATMGTRQLRIFNPLIKTKDWPASSWRQHRVLNSMFFIVNQQIGMLAVSIHVLEFCVSVLKFYGPAASNVSEQPREAQTLNCERVPREMWPLCEALWRNQPALPRCHLTNGFSIHRELGTGLGGRANQGSLSRGGALCKWLACFQEETATNQRST